MNTQLLSKCGIRVSCMGPVVTDIGVYKHSQSSQGGGKKLVISCTYYLRSGSFLRSSYLGQKESDKILHK